MKVLLFVLLISTVILGNRINKNQIVFTKHSFNAVAQPAPTYKVDLDLPPIERWNKALKHFDADEIRKAIDSYLKSFTSSKITIDLIEYLGREVDKVMAQPFADELRGVSKAMGIDLGLVVLINIVYDVTAFNNSGFKACTSIVAMDANNTIIHGRNLDYDPAPILKPLTYQADFWKNGKPLFMATTYAGYIGVITGSRHGAFSISGDERDKGSLLDNILSALKDSWPTFFLQRIVLERSTDYNSALNSLIKEPSIAPVYYIIGGVRPGEGAIVVKNRREVVNVTSMGDKWYIIETNYDPWNKPPASDDRRDAGIAAMNQVGKDNMNPEQLYKVLSSHLVFNDETTYTTIMSAVDSSVYHTMIRYDSPP